MWIETDPDSWQPSANGKSLCRIEPGSRFFDDEAARVQLRDQRRGDGGGGGDRDGGGGGAGDGDGGGDGDGDGRNALLELHDRDRTEASQLEEQLRHELSEHPRRRSRKRPED
jgi:hypothetical protein